MLLERNREYVVEITGYTAEGAGVARVEGQVLFVPGAIVGETCRVKVVKAKKSYGFGRVQEILRASEHRIMPACPAFPQCGGCDFWHMDYAEELRFKEERVREAMERIGGFSELLQRPILGAHETGRYRNKAIFPVQGRNGALVSGFYRPHSHDVVAHEDCLIQPKEINALRDTVCAWAREFGIAPYEEGSGEGLLRHIFVRSGETGAVLCLIMAAKPPHLEQLVSRITEKHPNVSGVGLLRNSEPGNVIMGGRVVTLFGETQLTDTLCGLRFRISPLAFYQVNHAQAERLYQTALAYAKLERSQLALDLYCGAGTITLCLAQHAGKAIGVEVVPEAVEDARANARLNGIENAEFYCKDAGQAAAGLAAQGLTPDVIVVDPPRKGLDGEAVQAILSMAPARVVYVSCDPGTLARDARLICEDGRYAVQELTPVDMFPRTRHVETCVKLERLP